MMRFSSNDVVVFDLDDTLYKEIDFVKSGYGAIARHFGLSARADEDIFWAFLKGENALQFAIDNFNLDCGIPDLLKIYREHFPEISLEKGAQKILSSLRNDKVKVGIISDGRSLTQRNKLRALGLDWIKDVMISEETGECKPHEKGYKFFMQKYPGCNYFYVGDNPEKDFISPNNLGWTTIGIKDDGRNIHKSNGNLLPSEYLPKLMISDLSEL